MKIISINLWLLFLFSFPTKLENINPFNFSCYNTVKPEKLSKFVKISSGDSHHAAIDQQGFLYQWGEK